MLARPALRKARFSCCIPSEDAANPVPFSHSGAPGLQTGWFSSNTANRPFAEELETDSLQDPAFKRLFCHPEAIENVVRSYAPENAERIDFSTLEQLNAELVGEALVRRYSDMLWTARTRDGSSRVVILLEFQATPDPLMPLRIAIYQLLAVESLLRRMRRPTTDRRLEVLSFVIYHGEGRWKSAKTLRGLFPRWVPGDYRVIFRDPDETVEPGDLARTILKLEQDRSVVGTLATLSELNRVASETGSQYHRLMAECVAEMLFSSGRITCEQLREVTTMAQVMTEYERSLEEWGRKWARREQAEMLSHLVRRKFGPEAVEELTALLDQIPESFQFSEAAIAVIDCATAEEFLARVRRLRLD